MSEQQKNNGAMKNGMQQKPEQPVSKLRAFL